MKVKCSYCDKDFLLMAVKNIKVKVFEKEMELQYFVCPHCKEVHRVCLKDHGYDVLKNDLDNAARRYNISINNPTKFSVSEMERRLKIVENKKKHLAKHVEVTNMRYPGTFTLVASENNNEDQLIYHENHGRERK